MFFCNQSCRLIVGSANFLRKYTALGHQQQYMSCKATIVRLLTKILEFPDANETRKFLKKKDYVMSMDKADVLESVEYLINIGISIEDIRSQPKILCVKPIILRNRHEILSECGCTTANVFLLNKYLSICNEPERTLKKIGVISDDIDLQQQLANCLNVKLEPCDANGSLKTVRMHILRLFFLQNNMMTTEEFDRVMNQYQSVRNRSFRWTKGLCNILTNAFNIPPEEIKDNFNMIFRADPDNVEQLLTIKSIDGLSMIDIMKQTPNLMSKSYEAVKYRLDRLKKFGISDESVKKCSRVLTLDSRTLNTRLSEMKSIKELDVMEFHPDVLKLVLNKFRVQSRLDHLNELDKRCYNMSTLTANVDLFQKATEVENDKNQSRDCVLFLARNLELDGKIVKNEISRHPYWQYIPFSEMKQTIDMLKRKRFRLEDIHQSMHIVLYSGELVLKRLEMLDETEQIEGHKTSDLSKAMKLKLILYQIESEFHFTGDGVWLDRKFKFRMN